MNNINSVFKYFEEICAIPHGSGNTKHISAYCMEFAKKHHLRAICDESGNVIIYKNGTENFKNAEPLILQGHLDMVCQKVKDLNFDFEKDSIQAYIEGDYIKARGTSLGADNGIAIAIIMAILESNTLEHPPLEAVFTTDEEIGMLGAFSLDEKNISAKRMINLDSDKMGVLIVSCCGGCDFKIEIPLKREKSHGTLFNININGLLGGHSGVDIEKRRQNANLLMGRILNHIKNETDAGIVEVSGGSKGNVIPFSCNAKLVVRDIENFLHVTEHFFKSLKEELLIKEKGIKLTLSQGNEGEFNVINSEATDKIMSLLKMTPNGVIEMSRHIDNLVETSLNLGVLRTTAEKIDALYTLRSNSTSGFSALCERMINFATSFDCTYEMTGVYPPWEYKENSALRDVCQKTYIDMFNTPPEIKAIHAGLECGLFSAKINNLDCVSMGADMYDLHSVNEKLSISSVEKLYKYLIEIIKRV